MENVIYYAHHLYKYNTKIEDWELELIEEKLPQYVIFNPSTHFTFSKEMTEEEIMNICLETVRDCEALVFSSLSGVVGRGVFSEVSLAMELGKDVYCLHEDDIVKVESVCFRPCKKRSNRTYMVVDHFEITEE